MLYSKKQRVWLPLYLPLNKTFIYIGHGALLLTPINGDSKFLGYGDYDGMGAATSEEDLQMLKQNYLKCNDVINGSKVPERFECFERIKFARRRLLGYLKYPFTIDSSLYTLLHGNNDSSQNSTMYRIFDEVNRVYIKNQNKKQRDVRNMCFLWDRRCIGIGGRKDPGLTKGLKFGLRATEFAEPQLYDLTVFLEFRVTLLQKEDGEMNEEIRRKKKKGEFVTLVQDMDKVLNATFYKALRLNHTTFVRWGSKTPQYKEWSKIYNEEHESDNNSDDDTDKYTDEDNEESSRNKKRKVNRISHHEEDERKTKRKKVIDNDVIRSAISSATKQIKKQYRSSNSRNTSTSPLKKERLRSREQYRDVGEEPDHVEEAVELEDGEEEVDKNNFSDNSNDIGQEPVHVEEEVEPEDGEEDVDKNNFSDNSNDIGQEPEHVEEEVEPEDGEEDVDKNNCSDNSNDDFEDENSNEDDENYEHEANDVQNMEGYILKNV